MFLNEEAEINIYVFLLDSGPLHNRFMSTYEDLLKLLQLCISNTVKNEVQEALTDVEVTADLLTLSCVHHISPMVYDQFGKTDAFLSLPEEERLEYKKQAVRLMSDQTKRTISFLQLMKEIQREGIDPIVVKGIIVRNLYPKPDLRVSADEDLIITENEFFEVDRFLKDHGYTTDYDGEGVPYEAGYKNLRTGVYLEIHTSLFEKENEVFFSYDKVLEGYNDRTIHVSIDGAEIRTLSVDDHLVYLIAHFAKHFRYSGAGIRQILDIIVFTEKCFESIDFNVVFNRLSEIGLYELADSIYDIGEEFLGFSHKKVGIKKKENIPDHEKLLKDIMEGGVYGRATGERLHSSSITLSDGKKEGIMRALFPSKEYIEKKYPYAKESIFGLLKAYGERINRYVVDNEDILGAVRKGKERSRLIQMYIDPEVRYDTSAYMENVREALSSDQNVTIPVSGNSMVPFLVNERDSVIIRNLDRHLKPGDIILYQRTNGRYILHRIIAIRHNKYITAGDHEDVVEKNIQLSQIIGYVVRVKRKGKWIDHTDRVWKFFSAVWLHLYPVHTGIIRLYTFIKKLYLTVNNSVDDKYDKY